MAGDRQKQPARLQTETAKAVARLMSFAQITCFICLNNCQIRFIV